MGYRSNVQVMTTLEGFEKMQDIIWAMANDKGVIKEGEPFGKDGKELVMLPEHGQSPYGFFDLYDAQEDYLCFGFDWVKWYDTYTSVKLFMDMLSKANEDGVPWQFIRVGEEDNDIEQLTSDNFWDNPPAVMRVQVDIVY